MYQKLFEKDDDSICKLDLVNFIKYCSNKDYCKSVIAKIISQGHIIGTNINIAVFAKLALDIRVEFKMEDEGGVNHKIKRLIINEQGIYEFLESDTAHMFLKELRKQ